MLAKRMRTMTKLPEVTELPSAQDKSLEPAFLPLPKGLWLKSGPGEPPVWGMGSGSHREFRIVSEFFDDDFCLSKCKKPWTNFHFPQTRKWRAWICIVERHGERGSGEVL